MEMWDEWARKAMSSKKQCGGARCYPNICRTECVECYRKYVKNSLEDSREKEE